MSDDKQVRGNYNPNTGKIEYEDITLTYPPYPKLGLPARKGSWMQAPLPVEGMLFWRYRLYIRVQGGWLVFGRHGEFEDALLTDDQIAEMNTLIDPEIPTSYAGSVLK